MTGATCARTCGHEALKTFKGEYARSMQSCEKSDPSCKAGWLLEGLAGHDSWVAALMPGNARLGRRLVRLAGTRKNLPAPTIK